MFDIPMSSSVVNVRWLYILIFTVYMHDYVMEYTGNKGPRAPTVAKKLNKMNKLVKQSQMVQGVIYGSDTVAT